jgi:hypothetical protein
MSKILFWSPLHGQGQTSNLHVTAFVMSLLHKKRVLMMQTHFNRNNLESPLVGENVGRNSLEESNLFMDIGLDTAVTYSNMNRLNIDMLENCCFTFPDTQILLLPGTETKNRDTFDRDIGKAVTRVIQDADKCVDVVLIDSNSGDDKLSCKLMTMADLIVINLTQHRYVLDKLFADNNDILLNKNVFYLFGEYDDNSSYNINNCRRKYRKYINHKNSGVIPYCTKFLDAQNESDVIKFMKSGLHRKEEGDLDKLINGIRRTLLWDNYTVDETEYFFHRSRLTVEKMLDLLHIPISRDCREGDKA